MTWAVSLWSAVTAFFRAIPLLAVWLAHRKGEAAGIEKQKHADDKINLQVKDKFEEIDAKAENTGDWLKE
jgi:hypothetical protein